MVGAAVGTALASVGGGVIAHLLTWRAAFVVTGVAAMALTFALRKLAAPPHTRVYISPVAAVLQVGRSTWARVVLALAFAEGAVVLGALTLLPAAVEADGASASVAGAATALYGVAVLGFARLVGHLSGRLHPSRLIGLGAASALIACLAMAVSQAPVVAIGVAALLALAWTAMHSTLQTWATEVMPDARATVVSMFAGSLFVGSAASAVAVAGLADAGRYGEIFALAAAATVPLGVFATWGRARWRGPGEEDG
jgi:predicted MFS family arabinose efflux permease